MDSSLCLGHKFNIYASFTDSDLLAREDTNHQLSSRKRITIRLFRSHAKPVIYKLLPSPFHPSLRNHRSEYCQHSVFILLLGRQSPSPPPLTSCTRGLHRCRCAHLPAFLDGVTSNLLTAILTIYSQHYWSVKLSTFVVSNNPDINVDSPLGLIWAEFQKQNDSPPLPLVKKPVNISWMND